MIAVLRRLLANLAHWVRRLAAGRSLLADGFWLDVSIEGDIPELAVPRLAGPSALPLVELLRSLRRAADDERVAGVLLRFHGSPASWSHAIALRRAVEEVAQAGKPVLAWGESFDARSHLVASAASEIWLPRSGSVALLGLRTDQFYLRDLFDQLDLRPEVVRMGSHKSAGEMFTRDSMSPEQREQLEGWLGDLYAEIVGAIARGRSLSEDEVRALFDGGPHAAEAAIESRLVDRCGYRDELGERMETLAPTPGALAPGPRRARTVSVALYHPLAVSDPGWRPLLAELPRVAYVVANGSIHRGGGARGIGSESFGKLLRQLGRDHAVRGVVLRVDSPGGDAVASDLLYREVELLAREKPVVVSMADVAASGGYYFSAAADWVFAEAGTVTGSIGVIGGKLDLSGLYRRLGIGRDAVETGPRAGLFSETRGFTPDERAALRREMDAIYRTFLDRVSTGRRLSLEVLEPLAQGKIWSGLRASALGLVDAVGGPLEALADVRRRAGLSDGEPHLLEIHPRLPLLPGLLSVVAQWTRVLAALARLR